MRQIWMSLTLIVVIGLGVWALANRSRIDTVEDALALAQEQIGEVVDLSGFQEDDKQSQTAFGDRPYFRIATLSFDRVSDLDRDPESTAALLEVISRFEIMAVQDIRCEPAQIRSLLDRLARQGRHYEFVLSPKVGTLGRAHQVGFLFDAEKIMLDGSTRYLVQDPDGLFTNPPFVGWFRTRIQDSDRAFTFSLVNVQLDAQKFSGELPHLAEVFRAVRADGRGEDDVIFAGSFCCGHRSLVVLSESGLVPVAENTGTQVRANQECDNILLPETAAIEFTRRGGVFDFMSVFNMSISQAESVSSKLPVWAEFGIYEGAAGEPFASDFDPRIEKR